MFVSIRSTALACTVFESMSNKMNFEELHNSLEAVYVKEKGDQDRFERAFKKVFNKIDLLPEENKTSDKEITGTN